MDDNSSGTVQGFDKCLFSSGKIYMITAPVDFRKGLNSLITVAQGAGLDLMDKDKETWVVFVSKVLKAVKIIHADSTGVMLLNRRLRHGRFQRQKSPREGVAMKMVSVEEITDYLNGEDIMCNRNFILVEN